MYLFRPQRSQSGIAIGPILFVIAILAVLAAAIAAGSGSFNASSSGDSAKTMAAAILQNVNDIETAYQKVKLEGGYTDGQVSFEVPASAMSTTADGLDQSFYTQNALCSVDACKVFKPAGGGAVANNWPVQAFDQKWPLQNTDPGSLGGNTPPKL